MSVSLPGQICGETLHNLQSKACEKKAAFVETYRKPVTKKAKDEIDFIFILYLFFVGKVSPSNKDEGMS